MPAIAVNLLDTPGHEDFSEDTYRTLVAADSAVMLLDNRKGVEERTRQLFQVCKRRRMPIFTLVNKCDRAGEDPLKLISDVEADLGIQCHAVTWPIFRGNAFVGVYDRRLDHIHVFDRGDDHGAKRADRSPTLQLDEPEIIEHCSVPRRCSSCCTTSSCSRWPAIRSIAKPCCAGSSRRSSSAVP
ncbi:MAG: GTP-binding protein [Gemmatimonadaceae bacterium]|nr:GTP-binding protein [Gemmatimonadaceae bacterium]